MTTIRRIDPAYWYVGMRNSHLQLMVCGEGIAGVRQVTTDYPGVTIEKVVCLESPNYLFIYIDIGKAKAGVMTLHIGAVAVDYELRRRERKGQQRKSFSMADVIYLLMPDRFAQGSNHPDYVEGMRPYQEVDVSRLQLIQQCLSGFSMDFSVEKGNGNAAVPEKGIGNLGMLTGQKLGRSHERHLGTVTDCMKGGNPCDKGLSRTDVALK